MGSHNQVDTLKIQVEKVKDAEQKNRELTDKLTRSETAKVGPESCDVTVTVFIFIIFRPGLWPRLTSWRLRWPV